MMDTSLNLEVPGVVTLGERGPEIALSTWDHVDYLREVDKQIDLDAGASGGEVTIELAGYHIPNTDETRHFHMRLSATLDRKQLAQLHRYLGFLLDGG